MTRLQDGTEVELSRLQGARSPHGLAGIWLSSVILPSTVVMGWRVEDAHGNLMFDGHAA
jgi:hypothetical protein